MQTFYFTAGGDFIKITTESLQIAKDVMQFVYFKRYYQIKEPKTITVTYKQRN